MTDEPQEWFLHHTELAGLVAHKIGIVLVANLQGVTRAIDDYVGDSVITEFLTVRELDELLEGFADAGLYCETVIDEDGFFRWLDGKRCQFPRPVPLVYNLAQNGTGPARLSVVAGLCRLHRLQLLDSDAYGVALARHKFHSAIILRQFGLPAARSWWFTNAGWWPEAPPNDLLLIAKPTYESASIGIHDDSTFRMRADIGKHLEMYLDRYRQPITVQEFVPGFEVEVPVFGAQEPRTLIAVGIDLAGKRNFGETFLTYDDVACDRYSFYDFAEEQESAAENMTRIARVAFRCLGLAGVARVDFRVGVDGSPVVIEVACKPHLTKHSSFMHAVASHGGSHADLLKFIVGSAAARLGIS